MRYKVAPPPRSLSFLAAVRDAVPLVPEAESDCCLAIQRATGVEDRERAREYLTFVRALGLVTESQRGYHRTQDPVEPEHLATPFRQQVFLVAELADALETGPMRPEDAFEAVRDTVPRWERERRSDWERDWQTRVEHLLGWGVEFGLFAVADGQFRLASQ
jgi:hypothetical protein